MTRHVVNFGLLFCFLTLSVSGVMSYAFPFSIVTTRVHIVFGATTFVLVGIHLGGRIPYSSRQIRGERKTLSSGVFVAIVVVWTGLLAAALRNWWPSRQIVEQGYESRHRAAIVRGSPLAGFLKDGNQKRFIAREPGGDADVAVALSVRFRQGLTRAPALAVWAETTAGTLIETLYLDEALAFSEQLEWEGIETERYKILPLWRHRHTIVSGIDPYGEVDASTGATPTHSFSLDDYLRLGDQKTFVLCLEVNAAGDPNEAFPDPHIGQPSLLYTAYIDLDAGGTPYVLLELTGYGNNEDKNGAVRYDLDRVTTAETLVDLLLAKIEPR